MHQIIDIPLALITCTVVAADDSLRFILRDTVQQLVRERPALQATSAYTADVTIACTGRGELHVSREHLRALFNQEVERIARRNRWPVGRSDLRFGEARAGYRETVHDRVIQEGHYIRGAGSEQFGHLRIELTPGPEAHAVHFTSMVDAARLPGAYTHAVTEGVRSVALAGVRWGYPLAALTVSLVDARLHPIDSQPYAYFQATLLALRAALTRHAQLLKLPQ